MDGEKAGGAMFMCRLCNLFSPSRGQLLVHCSQKHPLQPARDDLIVAMQPLSPEAAPAVKRKRGRPKGSTKKRRPDKDKDEGEEEERGRAEEKSEAECQVKATLGDVAERQEAEGTGEGDPLLCMRCHRNFRNRRQILKHICLKVEEEDEDEEEEEENNGPESSSVAGEPLGPGGLEPGCGADSSDQSQTRTILMRTKDVERVKTPRSNKRSRTPCTDRRANRKEVAGPAAGNRKSIISVVLTEHETLADATKMVPVEASPAEMDPAGSQAQPRDSAAPQTVSQTGDCPSNPTSDPEPSQLNGESPKPVTPAASRGFQEYAIKQVSNSLQSQLKIFTCEFCNKIFKFRHSLTAHLRTHTQEKPFQCPHCDYASAIKANLNVHLRKHTGEKFSCPHCSFTCLSPGHLKVHVERVHLKVKQHCEFCQKKYSDVKTLLRHMEQRHDLKDADVQHSYQQLRLKTRQGQRQLLYHCSTCGRRFKNHLERQRHLLVHGPLRPYACLLCDHATTNMATLTAHVRKHLFLYVCSLCSGAFVSSPRLKAHLAEAHPAECSSNDDDAERAFADCIARSYCLAPPGGDAERREEEEVVVEEEVGEVEEEEVGEQGGKRRREEEMEGGEGRAEERTEDEAGRPEEFSGEKRRRGEGEEREGGAAEEEEEERGVVEEERSPAAAQEERREEEEEAENGRAEPEAAGPKTATPTGDGQEEEGGETHDGSEGAAGGQSPGAPGDENVRVLEESAPAAVTPSSEHAHVQADENAHAPEADGAQGPTLAIHQVSVVDSAEQTAFQQVLSSLQKTQLNMETFLRLRRLYGDLECQYCGKLFWYQAHYNLHVRTHTKEHMHHCSKCSYSSITKSCLKRHLVQKHSGLLLPCSEAGCPYATPDKYKLQAHEKTHQQQQTEACPVCQQKYPENRLRHHIRTAHPDADAVHNKGVMVKRAEKCPYCDSYFLKNSSDLQQHIWAHQGLKPYRCEVCDYAGRSKSNLRAHMNTHSSERTHLCDLCGKKFKSKVTLKTHRLTHSAEGRGFHCSECEYTSVSKPALLRHMEQHADFKPYRCAHCHYSCNIAGPLKRHYNRKHPEQEYQNAGPGLTDTDAVETQGALKCPVCKFVYGTKWELNRHLKNRHNLKLVAGHSAWEVLETAEGQYVSVEDEEQQTEAAVAALQDNAGAVNILQQIIELSSENPDAVASVVTMAPGTVTVVEQVSRGEQGSGNRGDQVMVQVEAAEEEEEEEEEGGPGERLMVVEETEGLETLTVLTQGDSSAHHYIVYVEEQTVEIN